MQDSPFNMLFVQQFFIYLHNTILKIYHERKPDMPLHIIANFHSFLLFASRGCQFAFPPLSSRKMG